MGQRRRELLAPPDLRDVPEMLGVCLGEDVPVVLRAGGSGVAVVSGILGAEDVEAAAARYADAARMKDGSARI